MDMAKAAPLKITKVIINEITSSKQEFVFSFGAKYVLTDPLYIESGSIKCNDLDNVLQKLVTSGIKSGPVIDKLQAIDQEIQSVKILKVSVPAGTCGEIKGKSTTVLSTNGTWYFDYSLTQGQVQNGITPPANSRWFLDGSKEIKTYQDELSHRVNSLSGEVERAIDEIEQAKQKAAEEKKKAEDAKRANDEMIAAKKRAQEESFLSIITPDSSLIGKWNTESGGGKIGIRFGERLTNGSVYTIEGYLFDPSNPDYKKPFSAISSGDGSFDKPFKLHLSVNDQNGGVMISEYNNIERIRNKTLGFLLSNAHYEFDLTYLYPDKNLSGHFRDSFMYHVPAFGNNSCEVVIFFNKNINGNNSSPEVMSAGSSNSSNQEQVFFYNDNKQKAAPTSSSQTNSSNSDIDVSGPIVGRILHAKRTPYQVHAENALVLKEFGEEFHAARALKDVPAMNKIIQQVLSKYPETATTHYWLQNIAFLEHNSDEVKRQHDILISDFPETPELSAKREQQYTELMKSLCSGQ
jgi:hypothetical protein